MPPKAKGSPLSAWALPYQKITSTYVDSAMKLTRRAAKLGDVPDIMIGFTDLHVRIRRRRALTFKSLTKQDKNKSVKGRTVDTSYIQASKAWEAATAPSKSLPMNMMMMWMSGNGVQIFSMMVVMMMITNPLKGITSMHTVFAPYRSPKHSLLPQMAVFVLCHMASIALGVYKCWSMGLLPTEASDWLAWYKAPQVCMRPHPDFRTGTGVVAFACVRIHRKFCSISTIPDLRRSVLIMMLIPALFVSLHHAFHACLLCSARTTACLPARVSAFMARTYQAKTEINMNDPTAQLRER